MVEAVPSPSSQRCRLRVCRSRGCRPALSQDAFGQSSLQSVCCPPSLSVSGIESNHQMPGAVLSGRSGQPSYRPVFISSICHIRRSQPQTPGSVFQRVSWGTRPGSPTVRSSSVSTSLTPHPHTIRGGLVPDRPATIDAIRHRIAIRIGFWGSGSHQRAGLQRILGASVQTIRRGYHHPYRYRGCHNHNFQGFRSSADQSGQSSWQSGVRSLSVVRVRCCNHRDQARPYRDPAGGCPARRVYVTVTVHIGSGAGADPRSTYRPRCIHRHHRTPRRTVPPLPTFAIHPQKPMSGLSRCPSSRAR